MHKKYLENVMKDAYVCSCGKVVPLVSPSAFELMVRSICEFDSNHCLECGEEMKKVKGSWGCCEVYKGFWPFRKLKQVHWDFASTKNGG